jgi:hypothetical protein
VSIDGQPREWSALDDSHSVVLHYLTNGVDEPSAPFDPPNGTGSNTYAPFGDGPDPVPFHYVFRIETRQDDIPIFQSAYAMACTGNGPATPVVIDWLTGQPQVYYRWTYAPEVECITQGGGSVELRLAAQPREWKGLPADAVYDSTYSTNGDDTTNADLPLPTGDGSITYGAFGEGAPAYPVRFAFLLDTKVNGAVRYRSALVATCLADGPGVAHLFQTPEPAGAATALAALAALAAIARRVRAA